MANESDRRDGHITQEQKIEGLAKAFVADGANDPDYPWKTWPEQADEMRRDLTPAQIDGMFNMDPEFYTTLVTGVGR